MATVQRKRWQKCESYCYISNRPQTHTHTHTHTHKGDGTR